MSALRELASYKHQLSEQISSSNMDDCILPEEFKEKFVSFGEYKIERYNRFTALVSSKKSVMTIPNQWIFIAGCCCQYHLELVKYKKKLMELGIDDEKFEACHPSKDNKQIPAEEKVPSVCKIKAEKYLEGYQGEDKTLLVDFLWNYETWGGGKNIKRSNDFTESPVLNIANTINASSGLIGSIAKGIASQPDCLDILLKSSEWNNVFSSGNKEDYFEIYKEKLPSFWIDEKYKWVAVKHFQNNWNIDSEEFDVMFKEATKKNGNLLASSMYYPAGQISDFIKVDKDAVKSMFSKLYDESQDLADRINFFMKESSRLQATNPAWKTNYQDLRAISVYLTFKYPEKYYIYKYTELKNALDRLRIPFSFKERNTGVFYKSVIEKMNLINDRLVTDEELTRILSECFDEECYSDPLKHITTVDFVFFLGKRYVGQKETNDEIKNLKMEGVSSSLKSYLTAIRTKPFILLAGISGTGKSRIVRKLAQATDDIDLFVSEDDRWKLHSPSNFCLIQVKPNWHNSMDVVGFKSNIGKSGEHYEYTPFIEFISKAWKNVDTPFFLCLDEMNLAPVEEYFAEFLSAIESRSFGEDDQYETDPIVKPFKDFGDKVALDMIEHLLGEHYDDTSSMSTLATRFYNKGLTLPKNLIVMGTVNMDETTFSFSRKVLDRAMSIEMNEVSYDDFLSGKTEEDLPVLISCNKFLTERPISAQKVKMNIDADSVIDYLKNVNTILDGTPFKLGYRAANEALLYVSAAKDFGCEDYNTALDDFTLMKVLSRIEGDDSKLKTKNGEDLLELLKVLLDNQFGDSSRLQSQIKLSQMANILERDHFVSFWG